LQLLVGLATLVFLVVIVFFVRYLVNPRPIEELINPELSLDSPPHYLGSIYNVNHPVGVAVSPDDNRIYVSESGGERLVRVFDRRGQELGALVPTTMRAVERSPVYLAVSSDGHILVTDRSRHLISIYSPDGILETEYDPGWSPLGVRLSPDGILLITDVSSDHNSIHQLALGSDANRFQTPTLNEIGPVLGENGVDSGQLNFPNSAVRDARGRTYISDGNNWRIAVWDSNGDFLYHFGAGAGVESINLPRGLYIDHRQRLYVVDASAHKVKVYGLESEMPEFLFAFGDLGTGDENFQFPSDIAVDQNGRIYIADRENNRVQIWTY
jgi:DNA-binding beta-propeller fold protein YncE